MGKLLVHCGGVTAMETREVGWDGEITSTPWWGNCNGNMRDGVGWRNY